MNLLSSLNKQFVIPVIREKSADDLENICLALANGGLQILEITLMSETAFAVIEKLSVRNDLILGAGTVLSINHAKKAIDAGAKFLVSPGLNTDVLQFAGESNISYIPGVLSPTEIMHANALGCEFVKIFPIEAFGGPNYIKALRGPFPQLNCMATGGVSLKNLKEYIAVGATCVGLGGALLSAFDNTEARDWQNVSNLATASVNAVKTAKAEEERGQVF